MTNNADSSRISSDTAHSLRSPLAVIQMNSEIGLINPNIDKETRSLLTSNIEEVKKLSKMITDILEK